MSVFTNSFSELTIETNPVLPGHTQTAALMGRPLLVFTLFRVSVPRQA